MEKEKKEDLRTLRTKKHLSFALLELLTEKSMADISVQDLCEKAMTHRTTFYKHFSDKYDLLEYVINSIRERFIKEIESKKFTNLNDLYEYLITMAFDFIDENRDFLTKMNRHNDDTMLQGLLYGTIERSIEKLLKEREHDLKVPAKIISTFYANGFISVALWWLDNPTKYSKKEMIRYVNSLTDSNINI